MRICTTPNCGREVFPDGRQFRGGLNPRTGLVHVRCFQCGHRGLLSPDGPQLVFAVANRYVYAFGTASHSVTVTTVQSGLNMFAWSGLSVEDLARHAAEWVMLRGRGEDSIKLALDHPDFPDFYEYARAYVLPGSRVTTIDGVYREPRQLGEPGRPGIDLGVSG